jgi:hypothetical protein
MAAKNRPDPAHETLARQQAQTRRGAPGKRFIGERAGQSEAARVAERKKVTRMAERDSAIRRAEAIGTPIAAILAELVADAVKLARSLVAAPFRIVQALRMREV